MFATRSDIIYGRKRKRHLFLNSHFYTRLVENGTYNPNIIRTWHRKVDWFDREYIFCPVNIGNVHWVLVFINVRERTIQLCDSMEKGEVLSSNNKAICCNFKRFLRDNFELYKDRDFNVTSWRIGPLKCPVQEDGSMCGFTTVFNMTLLASHLPLKYVADETFSYHIRDHYALCLLCNQFVLKGDTTELRQKLLDHAIKDAKRNANLLSISLVDLRVGDEPNVLAQLELPAPISSVGLRVGDKRSPNVLAESELPAIDLCSPPVPAKKKSCLVNGEEGMIKRDISDAGENKSDNNATVLYESDSNSESDMTAVLYNATSRSPVQAICNFLSNVFNAGCSNLASTSTDHSIVIAETTASTDSFLTIDIPPVSISSSVVDPITAPASSIVTAQTAATDQTDITLENAKLSANVMKKLQPSNPSVVSTSSSSTAPAITAPASSIVKKKLPPSLLNTW